ncbi:MAG: thioredoxin domain-containing protein [Acidobacteriota bacterium]|nr:thioredoxin domain-containing protein [Acidobacteriota bacterium]
MNMTSHVKHLCAAFIAIICIQHICMAMQSDQSINDKLIIIEEKQDKILNELQSLKILFQSTKTASNTPPIANIKGIEFDLGDHPIMGSKDAHLIMIEITDYQCAFCSRYVRETFNSIKNDYVDNGKIRYAVMDNPLPMHGMAKRAAEASHCANSQSMFWEMHKQLMIKQESLSDLPAIAESVGINLSQFDDCLKTNRYSEIIDGGIMLAAKLGFRGVPAFVIGEVIRESPMKVRGISSMTGAQPFSNFKKELDSIVATPSKRNE